MHDCLFCQNFDEKKVIYEDDTWVAVYDSYPVSKGHALLIPKRHIETFFDLNYIELQSLSITIGIVKNRLDKLYHPNGYNIGTNCGECAGQTIHHCHIHIIPRYNGDMDDPRGGIRGCIPSKMKY